MQDIVLLMKKTTQCYRTIAILTLNSLVILVCLEVTSKAILRIRATFLDKRQPGSADPRERSSYYASKDWAAQYWKEFALARRQQYHAYTVWRRAPFKGKTINIDNRGVRLTPGANCSPNAFEVFTFGGSPMWGTGAPDWGTIPAYLQAGLAKYRPGPICVTNFAESAYVSTQSTIELILQLQSGHIPNVAVFFDGTNDIYTGYQSGRAGVHENLEQIAAKLEPRDGPKLPLSLIRAFSLYELVTNQVNRWSSGSRTTKLLTYDTMGVDANRLTNSIVRTYLSNYQIVATLAQKYGFEYYFFWPPYISIGKKPLTSEEEGLKRAVDPALEKLYQSVYQTMEPLVPRYKNCHSMTDTFDDYGSLLWLDDTHVTPAGNQLIAQKMLQVIMDRNH
jgi:lysophospholipase L1-like esterase